MDKDWMRAHFDALFERYYTTLVSISYRITSHQLASEDIVQDLFVHLWENSPTIDRPESIEPYLKKAAVNRSLNWRRNNRRIVLNPEIENHPDDGEDDPDQRKDQMARLQLLINVLPDRCRLIFTLHRFEGLTTKEIANYLSLSPKTIENQLGKALKILRSKIQ